MLKKSNCLNFQVEHDGRHHPVQNSKPCRKLPLVMLGSCTIKISSLAAKKDKSLWDLAILAAKVPIPRSRTSRVIRA